MKTDKRSEAKMKNQVMMKSKAGFTLIELMIVVAIIAIIAAIAIPNLIRSRQTADEGAAIGTMRTISSAEAEFQSAAIVAVDGMGMYGTLAEMGSLDPPFVDPALTTGVKAGYQFDIEFVGTTPGAPAYQAYATPIKSGSTARTFFVDQSGVLTFNTDGTDAGPTSPPVQ